MRDEFDFILNVVNEWIMLFGSLKSIDRIQPSTCDLIPICKQIHVCIEKCEN